MTSTSNAEIRNGICFVTLAGEFDRSNLKTSLGRSSFAWRLRHRSFSTSER